MAPGRVRPWTTHLNAHYASESGIETLRTRCIAVRATAVPLIHTFGRTVYSVNGTFTRSYPLQPVRQSKGHGSTRALVCSGDMIRA
jgi:hypothetical protein